MPATSTSRSSRWETDLPPGVVTIAGSDSGGGAGIQADLKTFAAFGVHGATVVTAVTAQSDRGVRAIHPVPADTVAAQIDAVFEDYEVAAVKIGMLGSAPTIAAVAAGLTRHRPPFVVLDPVLLATSGAPLLDAAGVTALVQQLLPMADLVTPNLPEAASLCGEPIAQSGASLRQQADAILALGAPAVLIKGGHREGAHSIDLLARADGTSTEFTLPRIAGATMRGTGCILSSAIAAGIAKGQGLVEAVHAAKLHVRDAIARQAAGSST